MSYSTSKNFIYFPSLSCGVTGNFYKKNELINNISPRFYTDNNDYYHPYFLMTAGHHYKNMNIREEWDMKKTLVLGDSGGFQIATGAIEWNNEIVPKIFNWLENNSDIAINLDIPPTKKYSGKFKECLDISKKNFEYFEKHQMGKTKFLNVLHGNNLEEYKIWYNEVKNFNFNGWAFGGCIHNIKKLLLIFSYLLEEKEFEKESIQNIHILGLSEISDFVIIQILQKFLNLKFNNRIQLSTDSSTPGLISAFGSYIYDINWTKLKKISLHIHKDLKTEEPLPCDCIYCKGRTFKDFENWKSLDYMYISMHNLKMFTDNISKIHKLINSTDDIIKDVIPPLYFKAYQAIKEIFNSEHPLKIYDKYINIFEEITSSEYQINNNNKSTNNLFEF